MPYRDLEKKRAAQRAHYWRQREKGLKPPRANAWMKTDAGKAWHLQYRRRRRLAAGSTPRALIAERAAARRREKVEARESKRRAPQYDAHVRRYREVLRDRAKAAARAATARGRLEIRMKTAIGKALRGRKGGRRWERLVGYTLDQLMARLESMFVDGMSWENIGLWHVDHIRPKSSFSYQAEDSQEFRNCWALVNLQPLWAEDNLRKGATMPSRMPSPGPLET